MRHWILFNLIAIVGFQSCCAVPLAAEEDESGLLAIADYCRFTLPGREFNGRILFADLKRMQFTYQYLTVENPLVVRSSKKNTYLIADGVKNSKIVEYDAGDGVIRNTIDLPQPLANPFNFMQMQQPYFTLAPSPAGAWVVTFEKKGEDEYTRILHHVDLEKNKVEKVYEFENCARTRVIPLGDKCLAVTIPYQPLGANKPVAKCASVDSSGKSQPIKLPFDPMYDVVELSRNGILVYNKELSLLSHFVWNEEMNALKAQFSVPLPVLERETVVAMQPADDGSILLSCGQSGEVQRALIVASKTGELLSTLKLDTRLSSFFKFKEMYYGIRSDTGMVVEYDSKLKVLRSISCLRFLGAVSTP